VPCPDVNSVSHAHLPYLQQNRQNTAQHKDRLRADISEPKEQILSGFFQHHFANAK
jgi:hypothetical protein